MKNPDTSKNKTKHVATKLENIAGSSSIKTATSHGNAEGSALEESQHIQQVMELSEMVESLRYKDQERRDRIKELSFKVISLETKSADYQKQNIDLAQKLQMSESQNILLRLSNAALQERTNDPFTQKREPTLPSSSNTDQTFQGLSVPMSQQTEQQDNTAGQTKNINTEHFLKPKIPTQQLYTQEVSPSSPNLFQLLLHPPIPKNTMEPPSTTITSRPQTLHTQPRDPEDGSSTPEFKQPKPRVITEPATRQLINNEFLKIAIDSHTNLKEEMLRFYNMSIALSSENAILKAKITDLEKENPILHSTTSNIQLSSKATTSKFHTQNIVPSPDKDRDSKSNQPNANIPTDPVGNNLINVTGTKEFLKRDNEVFFRLISGVTNLYAESLSSDIKLKMLSHKNATLETRVEKLRNKNKSLKRTLEDKQDNFLALRNTKLYKKVSELNAELATMKTHEIQSSYSNPELTKGNKIPSSPSDDISALKQTVIKNLQAFRKKRKRQQSSTVSIVNIDAQALATMKTHEIQSSYSNPELTKGNKIPSSPSDDISALKQTVDSVRNFRAVNKQQRQQSRTVSMFNVDSQVSKKAKTSGRSSFAEEEGVKKETIRGDLTL